MPNKAKKLLDNVEAELERAKILEREAIEEMNNQIIAADEKQHLLDIEAQEKDEELELDFEEGKYE